MYKNNEKELKTYTEESFLKQMSQSCATKMIVRLSYLRQNYRYLRNYLSSGTAICAVVKSDAYGHGLVRVSQVLVEEGVNALGIYRIKDACILRDSGITIPIILMGLCMPDEISFAVACRVTPCISSVEQVKYWQKEAKDQKIHINVHIAVDTGMGRIGCFTEDITEIRQALESSEFLKFSGMMSHLAQADNPDTNFTQGQIIEFEKALNIVQDKRNALTLHIANSAGILQSQTTHYNMVRIGVLLYGYLPLTLTQLHNFPPVFPVMELISHIIFIKKVPIRTPISYGSRYITPNETNIAIVPIGYSSGYSRCLSGFAEVLIAGKKYPVIGTICMEQIIVDVGNPTLVSPYDQVSLFGDINKQLRVETLAQNLKTIPHEILTMLSLELERIYKD